MSKTKDNSILNNNGKITRVTNKKNGKIYFYLRNFPLRYLPEDNEIEYLNRRFDTWDEAKDFQQQCIQRRAKLLSLTEDNSSVYSKFKKYVHIYLEPNWESQTTINNMNSFIENQMKPVFGSIGIKDCTEDDLQDFFVRQNKKRDVRKVVCAMRKFCKHLVKTHEISMDIMEDVYVKKHVPMHPQDRTPLTRKEESIFINELMTSGREAVRRYRHGILLMIYTGIRPAELTGGEWKNIHFDTHIFHVQKTYRKSGSKCTLKSTTKTGKQGERDVYIPDPCLEVLYKAMNRYPSHWIMENICTGNPISTDTLRRIVQKVAKDAGLRHRSIYPYLFRHTFATNCVRAGVPLADLCQFMGHKDETMLLTIYANHRDPMAMDKYAPVFSHIVPDMHKN